MSEVVNVINSDTAEKITTNRDSRTKHIDIYLLRNRRLVIEGCEDYKYSYWLSQQKVDEVDVNADVLAVTMYEQYDYVAHSVYLYSRLNLTQSDLLDGFKVEIKKVNGEQGVRFRAPWGDDSVNKSDEENGQFMAQGLREYYNHLLEECLRCEKAPEVLTLFDQAEKALAGLSGNTERDYPKISKYLKPMWGMQYLRLSENERFRLRYERLYSELSRIYNSHMSVAR